MVKTGRVDGALNVTKQANTQSMFNFGKEPLLQANASFYYDKTSHLDFNSSADIPTGTSIALIIGYEYGNDYQKNKHRFHEVRLGTQQQIIQLVRKKRVDMAIMFDEVAKDTMKKMVLSSSELKQGKINHQSDIYVAFSKQKNTTEKMRLLDYGLTIIKHTAE